MDQIQQILRAKVFQSRSFQREMTQFQEIMKVNPEKGKELLNSGQALVDFASKGNYHKFVALLARLVLEQEEENELPFLYFLNKSLQLSLFLRYFMISTYIIDAGFPINNSVPNLAISCLKNSELDDSSCNQILQFLSLKHFDFNRQVIAIEFNFLYTFFKPLK